MTRWMRTATARMKNFIIRDHHQWTQSGQIQCYPTAPIRLTTSVVLVDLECLPISLRTSHMHRNSAYLRTKLLKKWSHPDGRHPALISSTLNGKGTKPSMVVEIAIADLILSFAEYVPIRICCRLTLTISIPTACEFLYVLSDNKTECFVALSKVWTYLL